MNAVVRLGLQQPLAMLISHNNKIRECHAGWNKILQVQMNGLMGEVIRSVGAVTGCYGNIDPLTRRN